MSKLFKLKEWLSVSDAGKRLSLSFGEDVTEADVLQLALDGHLKLSIYLVNGAYARRCVPVSIEEIEWEEVPMLTGSGVCKIPLGGRVFQEGNDVFQVEKIITPLQSGIWDLPMTGGERIDVEHRLKQIVSGLEVTAVSLEGVLLSSPNGDLYEVQSRHEDDFCRGKKFFDVNNFHPAGCLPDDAFFVVRTAAIRSLEQSADGTTASTDKPIATRERNILLSIIAVLCNEAKMDYAKPAKTANLIADTAAKMGLAIGESTIEGHLKKIPDALGTRMK